MVEDGITADLAEDPRARLAALPLSRRTAASLFLVEERRLRLDKMGLIE
jgi:hypothetical protein